MEADRDHHADSAAAQALFAEMVADGATVTSTDRAKCVRCKGPPQPPKLKLFSCAACKCSWYCSARCQRKDWKVHKKVCAALAEKCAHPLGAGAAVPWVDECARLYAARAECNTTFAGEEGTPQFAGFSAAATGLVTCNPQLRAPLSAVIHTIFSGAVNASTTGAVMDIVRKRLEER